MCSASRRRSQVYTTKLRLDISVSIADLNKILPWICRRWGVVSARAGIIWCLDYGCWNSIEKANLEGICWEVLSRPVDQEVLELICYFTDNGFVMELFWFAGYANYICFYIMFFFCRAIICFEKWSYISILLKFLKQ